MLDMNWREKVVFAPLIALVLFMGVYPKPFLDVMAVSVENLIADHQESMREARLKREGEKAVIEVATGGEETADGPEGAADDKVAEAVR